ncbi:hypothetical protein DYH09_28905 [bacterium CPR1]|nr:hypothetical protein [bacterium CPR1]
MGLVIGDHLSFNLGYQNGLIEDGEILVHLQEEGLDVSRGDARALVDEFKLHLEKRPHTALSAYPSSERVAEELGQLERRYPALSRRVSLGQTHEGREIWALQISRGVRCEDTSSRPGVVLTGLHHAREWMSSQPPLEVARQLLEGYASDPEMKRRVDQAEIWVVPVVNPDGYEYSRSQEGVRKSIPLSSGQKILGPIGLSGVAGGSAPAGLPGEPLLKEPDAEIGSGGRQTWRAQRIKCRSQSTSREEAGSCRPSALESGSTHRERDRNGPCQAPGARAAWEGASAGSRTDPALSEA